MSNQQIPSNFLELLNLPIRSLLEGKTGFYSYVIDAALDLIIINQPLRDLTGNSATTLKDYHNSVHKDDVKALQRHHRNAFINREDYRCHYRMIMADGSVIHLEEHGKALTGSRGDFSGIFCQVVDLSDKKDLEDDLKTAMEMARFPMENPNPVFRVVVGGKLLFANSPSVRLLEKLGLRNGLIKDASFVELLNNSIDSKEPSSMQVRLDEETVYSLFISPAIAENYANVYTSDISETVELNKRMLQHVADLNAVINSTEEVMILLDSKMNLLAFNQKAEALSRNVFNKNITLQSHASEYFQGPVLLAFEQQFHKCLSKATRYEFEYDFITEKQKLWFKVLFNPVFAEDHAVPTGVCLSIKDITESRDDMMQLEAQKAFYEIILDNIPTDIAIFDDQHRYMYVNPHGIKDKNLRTWMIGKTDYDYCKFRGIGTTIADERRALFASVLKNKKEMAIESEHILPDGSMKYMLRKFYPFYQNDQLKLMIGYGVDITDIKMVQKSFMQSEHRYRTLFENNPLMVFILDKAGTIISTNASVSAELGYTEKQLTGRSLLNFFPEVNRNEIAENLSMCFENPDKEYDWDARLTKKSGKLIDAEARAKVIYSETGAPQLLLVCNNITNRKQNERLLEESEKLNRRLIQELPVPVAIIQDGKPILTNDAFIELTGTLSDKIEQSFADLVVPEDQHKLSESHEKLLRGAERVDYSVRLATSGNTSRYAAIRDSFFNYKNHLVTLSVMNDITDRVSIEKKNKEIEERTRQIIDASLDAIILTDLSGDIVDWNNQAQKMFNWKGREMAGKKLEEVIYSELYEEEGKQNQRGTKLTLNRLTESQGIATGGKKFPIELFISQIVAGGGKLLAFYIRDISDRKESEMRMQEAERIETILAGYSSSVHQIDNIPAVLDYLVATFNSICNLCEISVYLVDLSGQSLIRFQIGSTLLPGGTDDFLEQNLKIGEGLLGKAAEEGSIIIVQDRSKDKTFGLSDKKPGAELAAALLVNNKVFAVLHYQTHIIGFFSEFNQSIIRKLFESTSNRISKIIDEQHQLKMTRELIRNNAQLQQYSYIVSHNLRAPIANLLGLSKIFNQNEPSDERNRLVIKNIESSAVHIDAILRDLNEILSIKKDASRAKEYIRFEDILSATLKGLEQEITKANPVITTDFKVEGIKTIKPYMTSIFSNLIGNAIKYRSDKRTCELKISTTQTPGSIVIVFEDNGIGIDMERFGDKIFGLYKRFHTHVEGTGIGLHLVKSQVEALNGHILLTSKVDKGTRFTIEIHNE